MSRAELCTEGSSYGWPFQTTLTVRPLNSHSSYFAPSTFKRNESASACAKLHLTCVTPLCFFFSSSPITFKCWAVCLTLREGPDRAHFQSELFCMVAFRARLRRIIEHADALLHCLLLPTPQSCQFIFYSRVWSCDYTLDAASQTAESGFQTSAEQRRRGAIEKQKYRNSLVKWSSLWVAFSKRIGEQHLWNEICVYSLNNDGMLPWLRRWSGDKCNR